jgi:hypothetical protein
MKANDLRIGNLVYAFKTVWNIDSTDFANPEQIETFEPIPLTKEWMSKIEGIKRNIYRFYCERFVFIYHPKYNLWRVFNKEYDAYLTKVEYLHELQNFWYVMYGEELIIKNE